MKYRHCFDLGIFIAIKDNGDGTAQFIKEPEVGKEGLDFVLPERRSNTYSWKEMRQYP